MLNIGSVLPTLVLSRERDAWNENVCTIKRVCD